MKIDPDSRVGSALYSIIGGVLRLLLFGIGATLRFEVVEGKGPLRRLQNEPRPVILSFWHEFVFVSAYFLYRRLHRRGLDITLLASQSRDGELVARMVEAWGVQTVRGSASRGGMEALRAIHAAVRERGSSPIMTPDGPRGPLHVFKMGVVVLAQLTSAPVLPIGIAVEKCWRLGSWDRLIIPKPFSRVKVVIGELEAVGPRLNPKLRESTRVHLEEVLNDVTRRAEQALGR
ncbi:MAG: lysophospholipid acyltransferase family protein [Acidobacteriota bacterium]